MEVKSDYLHLGWRWTLNKSMQMVIYSTVFQIILVIKKITNYTDWKRKPENDDLPIYKHCGMQIKKTKTIKE